MKSLPGSGSYVFGQHLRGPDDVANYSKNRSLQGRSKELVCRYNGEKGLRRKYPAFLVFKGTYRAGFLRNSLK